MSTRSCIARANADGTFTYVYCHSDGYPEKPGVGYTLATSYTDPAKIDALLALGDLSGLNEQVAPPEGVPHGFDYGSRAPGVTIAYGRDRGETDVDADTAICFADLKIAARDMGAEYAYIFTDGAWRYYSLHRTSPSELSDCPALSSKETADA